MVACYSPGGVQRPGLQRRAGRRRHVAHARQSRQDFSLTFDSVRADERMPPRTGRHLPVQPDLSRGGRTTSRQCSAYRDGLIVEHHDHFQLWRWARQGAGTRSCCWAGTSLVQGKIRQQAGKRPAAQFPGRRFYGGKLSPSPLYADARDRKPPPLQPWYVYLVRTANGSFVLRYISDNPERRFNAHQSGRGARYFSTSPAVALVYVEAWPDKAEALRRGTPGEAVQSAKEALVASWTGL